MMFLLVIAITYPLEIMFISLDIVNIPSVPELAKQVSASAELEDDDEKFVPTRIILPVCSLGLALLAGPLALPPLAIGFFIIGSAHLSFRRAWDGLKKDRMINVDFLDSLAVLLHSLEGFLLGPAMMITMVEGGEAVRDATQCYWFRYGSNIIFSPSSYCNTGLAWGYLGPSCICIYVFQR